MCDRNSAALVSAGARVYIDVGLPNSSPFAEGVALIGRGKLRPGLSGVKVQRDVEEEESALMTARASSFDSVHSGGGHRLI